MLIYKHDKFDIFPIMTKLKKEEIKEMIVSKGFYLLLLKIQFYFTYEYMSVFV